MTSSVFVGQIEQGVPPSPPAMPSASTNHRRRPPAKPGELELGERSLLALAEGLAHSAHWWSDAERPSNRSWQLMVASEDFEAWVIELPPGGAIDLHDHGDASGALVVTRGELVETVVAERSDGRVEIDANVLSPGRSVTFCGAHIHDIANLGTTPALSVHVYAPRLTTMTFYEVRDGRLETGRTIRYRLDEATP
jgi:predicted metal-dependent enzyme (double-stranded beta helix superfamily)